MKSMMSCILTSALIAFPASAKTLIPPSYTCDFDQKEGKYFCATTCIDSKTGKSVHINPAACRLKRGTSRQ
jgi:hypothetical protein